MIKKAIFPVGGLGTRFLPITKSIPKEMLPIIDKPLIQYAVEEAAEAGCEEFVFVTSRGKSSLEDHFDHSFELEHILTTYNRDDALALTQEMMKVAGSISYVRQQKPAGLGHAVWCARHLVHDEPVAIILADDLIRGVPGCLKQMVQRYTSGNMIAVMEVEEDQTSDYGIVTPGVETGRLVEIKGLVEKPQPQDAPSRLAVVGRYIVEPQIFEELSNQNKGVKDEVQLTDSLAQRIGHTPFYGLRFQGTRYDCGTKLGFLKANIAYALSHREFSVQLKEWIRDDLDLF